MSLLSTAATTRAAFEALPETWKVCAGEAEAHGRVADRARWRLVGPVHVAETRERARANVRFGIQEWLRYFAQVGHLPLDATGAADVDADIDALIDSRIAVIGTPDDHASRAGSGFFWTWRTTGPISPPPCAATS